MPKTADAQQPKSETASRTSVVRHQQDLLYLRKLLISATIIAALILAKRAGA